MKLSFFLRAGVHKPERSGYITAPGDAVPTARPEP